MRINYCKNHDIDIIIKSGVGKKKFRFKKCDNITIDNEKNMIEESFDGVKVIETITTITIFQHRVEK